MPGSEPPPLLLARRRTWVRFGRRSDDVHEIRLKKPRGRLRGECAAETADKFGSRVAISRHDPEELAAIDACEKGQRPLIVEERFGSKHDFQFFLE